LKVIGLTGAMASGKSTVAGRFRRWGAEVMEADRIGHDLLRPNSPAYGKLAKAFGWEIFVKGGLISRKRLGRIVFADPKARLKLDRIVHPLLLRALRKRILEARRETGGMLVVVAALIPEWGIEDWFDGVVAVRAPLEKRLERLVDSGFTSKEARQRLASQLPERGKCRRADMIIENRGSLSDLRKEARLVWDKIKEESCFRN
jgi:dephospho-CoA kinase